MHARRARPGPGQESVWEYPRPPLVQPTDKTIEITFDGRVIARTNRALRVVETGHAPVYYVPLSDVQPGVLVAGDRVSYCDFKGEARYYHVVSARHRAPEAAWSYASPKPGYESLAGYVAFYPASMDSCLLDGEQAIPQPGRFHGGWVTADVVGPFIGEPGALGFS